MGTNFYLPANTLGNETKLHIGKRSAAGLYCWDCKLTLCKQGKSGIHESKSEWHKVCPKCGQEPVMEALSESTVGRELGFNTSTPQQKQGVRSCSSFTWALDPEYLVKNYQPHKTIEDEYDRVYTLTEFFAQVLQECPVHFKSSIGVEFS
jgi:hypothetical protein